MMIIIYYQLPDLSFIAGLLPGAASGAIGAKLGGKIVTEAPTRSRLFAARRGMAVMFLSLLFYCLIVSSFTGIIDGSAIYALNIFTEFTLVGLIGFGWLIALVGAIGGLCLYWMSSRTGQRRELLRFR
jgi:membrane associated rhomboid family serine protease